jgi:hypothetical protein
MGAPSAKANCHVTKSVTHSCVDLKMEVYHKPRSYRDKAAVSGTTLVRALSESAVYLGKQRHGEQA